MTGEVEQVVWDLGPPPKQSTGNAVPSGACVMLSQG